MDIGLTSQFPLRLSADLRDAIKIAAKNNFRTMNAEIVFQLGQIYQRSEQTQKADATAS